MCKVISLVGNPNSGKSTLFNNLTGLKQHTGNWTGKTVENAKGHFEYNKQKYEIYDLPGTYSLYPKSGEEKITSDFILNNYSDITIIICDGNILERSLILCLQILEIKKNVILCINFLDELNKKNICIDCEKLSKLLNIPVVPLTAKKKNSIQKLLEEIDNFEEPESVYKIEYTKEIYDQLDNVTIPDNSFKHPQMWLKLRFLTDDMKLFNDSGSNYKLSEICSRCIILNAEDICNQVVKKQKYSNKSLFADKILTSKLYAYPIMLVFLFLILWITISFANYPSELLSEFFKILGVKIFNFLTYINVPTFIKDAFINGIYNTTTCVISVMLPPMAIFFPLFSILEDSGYLPRIAFNLDKPFNKCSSCGKQSLTMCMGLGCNAVGVTGTRIIDSYRERILAIITNTFMPCNGRFPTMIMLISIFLPFGNSSIITAMYLALFIVISILVSFLTTYFIGKKFLKGTTTSYIFELPPYRKPEIFKTLVFATKDKTLNVLLRAVKVAAPAGLIIWLMANIYINDTSILSSVALIFEPLGKLIGLDGVILLGFILGSPANEIVFPVILMTYLSEGSLSFICDYTTISNILISNNWTILTAINTILFSLMHWPCATTVQTIYKETKSIKITLVSILLPTIIAIVVCIIFNLLYLNLFN